MFRPIFRCLSTRAVARMTRVPTLLKTAVRYAGVSSVKPREYDGKRVMGNWFKRNTDLKWAPKLAQVNPKTDLEALEKENPWLLEGTLVVKMDQLVKRRGKGGLLLINKPWAEIKQWIAGKRNTTVKVEAVSGVFDHFLVEPFIPHDKKDEYYFCFRGTRKGDEILFYHEGGINVGAVDEKASRIVFSLDDTPEPAQLTKELLSSVPKERQAELAKFVHALIKYCRANHLTFMEINPIVMKEDLSIWPLDMAAKIDETVKTECRQDWGDVTFPEAFGKMEKLPEEEFVEKLDNMSGASLKLQILQKEPANPRIWTMIAGGGASVIFTDTIFELGFGKELANYGEYSGDPSEELTFQYAKQVFDLMTRKAHPDGKILLLAGGIANFTDVAATFKGIIRAIRIFATKLLDQKVKIYIRRGGPNYQQGLQMMRDLSEETKLPIDIYGPELHMTEICSLALGLAAKPFEPRHIPVVPEGKGMPVPVSYIKPEKAETLLFTPETRCIIYGQQDRAVQSMMDFDYVSGRKTPSVAAVVYEFQPSHLRKFFWGTKEVLVPVIQKLDDALKKFPDVDSVVNFMSQRAAYQTTMDCMDYPQIKNISVIAEGVPERRAREIVNKAQKKGITIIGPATVGGLKPGCFRIGNTGGMLDNIMYSRLYRPGSVAYCSRSGGMANELNNIIGANTDGVYEGIAIGGDRYPGSTFIDHVKRYNEDPNVKMIVMLGEVGGTEEYEVVEMLEKGEIKKPLVAWCIGTCAPHLGYEVQFGHAGSRADAEKETASFKNSSLKKAGAIVPESFEGFNKAVNETYAKLVDDGIIKLQTERAAPIIPVDYAWAKKLGMVRKKAAFINSICDESGPELFYLSKKISEVLNSDMGLGGPRFGGALNDAARQFTWAFDNKLSATDFVDVMRQKRTLIQGIGHRLKSKTNPDVRCELLNKFVKTHFKNSPIYDFACTVEDVTTQKNPTLILNVDGAIAVAFCDLLRHSGIFTKAEADMYIEMGCLNALFVIGRSIGFIGHYIDQNRLKQDLYRHPLDDITYIVHEKLDL